MSKGEFENAVAAECETIQKEIDKIDEPGVVTYRPVGDWRTNWEDGAFWAYEYMANEHERKTMELKAKLDVAIEALNTALLITSQ